MTKEEALATLREQGHEVTEEEAKALEALLATGELDEADLDKVVGGLNPKFKKALIAAGVLVGSFGVYKLGGAAIRKLRPHAGYNLREKIGGKSRSQVSKELASQGKVPSTEPEPQTLADLPTPAEEEETGDE